MNHSHYSQLRYWMIRCLKELFVFIVFLGDFVIVSFSWSSRDAGKMVKLIVANRRWFAGSCLDSD